jgi:hypothetical protein
LKSNPDNKKGGTTMPRLISKSAGLFKVKINLDEFFYDDIKDADPKQPFFVVLREPTTEEAMSLSQNKSESDVINLIPNLIVDHSFLNEEDEKMLIPDVWKLIKMRSAAAIKVINDWTVNIPLMKQSKEK